MATVKLILNERYKSKDGYQVVFKIGNKGTHSHLPTGISLSKTYWDKKKWIKSGAPGITDPTWQNAQFQKELSDIQSYLVSLKGELEYLTAAQAKEKYINHKTKGTYNFNTYFDYFTSTKTGKTKEVYQYTHNIIKKNNPSPLSFSDVNVRFLRDLEIFMSQSMKTNSVGIHMRNIRAVFNAAIDDEIIDLSLYPFRKFKIKKEKTAKRNLSIEEIKNLIDADLRGVPKLSCDVFVLSLYLIGINLKDLSHLTKDNIVKGRLEYKRLKTGQDYSIKLEPEAMKIIKKLSGKKYLINLMERYECYDTVKKEINKKLKKAAEKAKIDKRLTTYYARHSWATIAAGLDIPKETISAALGHEIGSKTTSIYIDYDQKKVDEANRKVIDAIVNTT
jgi:integrase